MRVNNVCITGSITLKEDGKPFQWRQKTVQFYDNSIVLKKKHYQLCLTKNIRCVLKLKNLLQIFKRRIELEFGQEIESVALKIGNIHHSTKLDFNSHTLIENFIPELNKSFTIEECQVTQEQNAPVQTTLTSLLMLGNLTFLAINLKLLDRTVTIKLQVDKTKIFTHATLIITQFSQPTQRLIDLFKAHQYSDVSAER